MARIVLSLIAALATVSLSLPASAQFNPLSIIKGAVEAAVEDRSAEDIAKDAEIKTKITVDVIDKMGSEVISINADVYEQDVMLTGVVEKTELKSKAGKLAGGVEGVKKVINEIMVIKPVSQKKGAVEGFVDDTVIDTKINGLLLDGKGVNVTNFRWRSVQGHVFLFGRAFTSAEKSKAIGIVKGIEGIQSVTDRVKVRPKS
ncbi:MAG: BON domain-containing protein [Rhodospirillaceae bacterium]|nr:BON domain-containing protein [Rhodospirillaceae bacterium]